MNRLCTISVGLLVGSLSMGVAVLGVVDSKLSPCNGAWNCVITQQVQGQKPNAEAIYYKGSRKEAVIRLKKVIQSFDRAQITGESDEYIQVTVTSKIFGFVDDVEFFIPKNEKVIHIRSAARTGIYDFGVNKKRVSTIKSRFEAKAFASRN